jgi:hypothetical protein
MEIKSNETTRELTDAELDLVCRGDFADINGHPLSLNMPGTCPVKDPPPNPRPIPLGIPSW